MQDFWGIFLPLVRLHSHYKQTDHLKKVDLFGADLSSTGVLRPPQTNDAKGVNAPEFDSTGHRCESTLKSEKRSIVNFHYHSLILLYPEFHLYTTQARLG